MIFVSYPLLFVKGGLSQFWREIVNTLFCEGDKLVCVCIWYLCRAYCALVDTLLICTVSHKLSQCILKSLSLPEFLVT